MSDPPRERWLSACLLLLPLAIFADVLPPGRSFFYRDILSYWYPQAVSVLRCVSEGSWPVWNPYFGFGAPMLADASHQIFYPFTWLMLLAQPAAFYKAMALAHTALAAAGAFRLARRYGQGAWPAFVAAALWACSGPFLSTLAMNHHFSGAAWLPWVLLRVEDVLDSPGARSALRLGLAGGLQLLAGSADMCLMTALAGCARGAVRLLARRRSPAGLLRLAGAAGLSALLALGVAAAQWLPTLAVVRGSGRAQMTSRERGYWSLAPAAAVDLLLPRLVADAPLGEAARQAVFESREPFLPCLYVGVLGVPLAALGAFSGRRALFSAGAAALFLALAAGQHNPLYGLLLELPPFHLLRYPVKYLVPFALFFSLLCGFGVQKWLDRAARPSLLLAVAVAAFAVAAGCAAALRLLAGDPAPELLESWLDPRPERRLAFHAAAISALVVALSLSAALGLLLLARRRSPRAAGWTAAAMAALALGDGLRVAQAVNPSAPLALVSHVPPALASLGPAQSLLRIYAPAAPRRWLTGQLAFGPAGWDSEARWSLGLTESLQPLRAAGLGLYGSYDGDFTGLAPAATGELRGLLDRFRATHFGLRLLQLGNVGFVVTLERDRFAALPETGPPLRSVFREPVHVLRVPDPQPRAYLVDRARVAAEPASYVQLADPQLDLRREVVLAPPAMASPGTPGFSGSVRLLDRRMDRVELEAELNAPGFLVLVEAFEQGWRVEIDGVSAPVLRANALFRAAALPAGRHRVRFVYRPPAVAIGMAVSGATLLLALALRSRACVPLPFAP